MKPTYFIARNADIPAYGRFNLGSLLYEYDNPEALVEGFERIPLPPATGDPDTMNSSLTTTQQVVSSVNNSSAMKAGLWVRFCQIVRAKLSLAKEHELFTTSTAVSVTNERFIPSRAYLNQIFEQSAVQRYLEDNRVLQINPKLYLVTGIRRATQGASSTTSASSSLSGEASLGSDATTEGAASGEVGLGSNKQKAVSSSHQGSSPIIYAWRVHAIHSCRIRKRTVARQVGGELYSSNLADDYSGSDSEEEPASDPDSYEHVYDEAVELALADIVDNIRGREGSGVDDDNEQADVVLSKDQ